MMSMYVHFQATFIDGSPGSYVTTFGEEPVGDIKWNADWEEFAFYPADIEMGILASLMEQITKKMKEMNGQ